MKVKESKDTDKMNPSSEPNDELIKTMLASNKLIQESMQEKVNKIQNQIRKKSKYKKVENKRTGLSYEPVRNPSIINNELLRIHSNIVHWDYDKLKENVKIAGLDPEKSSGLMEGKLSKVKKNLLKHQKVQFHFLIFFQQITVKLTFQKGFILAQISY